MVSMTCLKLSLPAVPASIRRARNAVGEAVAELAAAERVADDVRLCVSEAVTNVVRHAYGGPGRGALELVVERHDGEVEIVVRDSGHGIAHSMRRGAGGYGMKIIDKLSRRLEIRSTPRSGTELRMLFDLDPR